jgi:hypothetical protein
MEKLLAHLDQPTLDLLRDLQLDFEIFFQPNPVQNCSVFTLGRTATISYNPKDIETESIAHELLHVWLKRFDFGISNQIYLSFIDHESLKTIFHKALCDHIGNCMDHYKMYPRYKTMGYCDEKFLQNGIESKCNIVDVNQIQMTRFGMYSTYFTDQFIGHLIAILADHYPNDYSRHLEILKNQDSELLEIVTEFWNAWVQFDITNIDAIHNSDRDIGDKFISDMEYWAQDKIFTL